MIGLIQIFAIKKKQSDDTTTDGSICKIKDWAEEYEMFSTDDGHPRRPVGLDDREIEHIHNFTIKPC